VAVLALQQKLTLLAAAVVAPLEQLAAVAVAQASTARAAAAEMPQAASITPVRW
jgi:hypothetical protein